MSWTRPSDVCVQVQRLWASGRLLASLVTDNSLFPLRLTLKSPSAAEMVDRFAAAREWIDGLRQMQHIRLEMRERNHRVLGHNTIPTEVWVDTFDDAIAMIGKRRDVERFTQLLNTTRDRQQPLVSWLAKRPLRALELHENWDRLLAIVAWLQSNPAPGVYLRQVDIADVHSKFIEAHRGVLQELLDIVMAPEHIDVSVSGVSQFARRYGFQDKPQSIRFRVLDSSRALLPVSGRQDMTLDAETFSCLNLNVARVFITENEINYLAFPPVANSMVIFGAGYGFDVFKKATWLSTRAIFYWGDIDTHGFGILDQLRSVLPHAESFLMDRETLMSHKSQWVSESQPLQRILMRLNDEEAALFNDLRDNRVGLCVRLEQERIRFGWFEKGLGSLVHEGSE